MADPYTNDLIHESSPYLLQHAHNPVQWKPWKPEVLEEAVASNRLLLISIGYASCHWCHVMEQECFEDSEVAEVMNAHFINIKVDREERPDIDQVYMTALQVMTGQGGWPLNIVALPDGRPVWGGTYLSKDRWTGTLWQIRDLYEQEPRKLQEYATRLEQGLQRMESIVPKHDISPFSDSQIRQAVSRWRSGFDYEYGGPDRAPKFMMPGNIAFLLDYASVAGDKALMQYVELTLTKMAYGGIYDQVGGGFSRYSTDRKWHVPHFEKMLYDNGQLVSLYANAYAATGSKLYKTVVFETLEFVRRELTGDDGAFYSSLDADSTDPEGRLREGAYYTWKEEELKTLLGDDFPLFAAYYNINGYGLWEEDRYVLIRSAPDREIAARNHIEEGLLSGKLNSWKHLLLDYREQRPRPRLDDKILTSWNALMLKGYTDAYKVFGERSFLEAALKNARFILEKQYDGNGRLFRNHKGGKSSINAFLEDYAAVTDAFIALHEATLDEQWLQVSRALTDYVFTHFHDPRSHMFFFTSDLDAALIARSVERQDNVIPSSNSIMAGNLFVLSRHFDDEKYGKTASLMLQQMLDDIQSHPSFHANWLSLMLYHTSGFREVVISGPEAAAYAKILNSHYLPLKTVTGTSERSGLPLLRQRYHEDSTVIYLCKNNTCTLPTGILKEVVKNLKGYE
ncbi:thioredoxin domain-containing protein [Sinomicrobium soli]|uniref:thioredoxin domain-containing protein n=1 Tax=Sinomicrobium sp. N-1-3-6 TaxID=2219864 RepID=UPI000DCC7FA6|nr:thioredoxin domain-containing protein [Sinomicrobium sp. N-1-3-6]RAV30718.1 thioredoxin domain-containing protein [Sinomicrobium sp. N-1-3-6]